MSLSIEAKLHGTLVQLSCGSHARFSRAKTLMRMKIIDARQWSQSSVSSLRRLAGGSQQARIPMSGLL